MFPRTGLLAVRGLVVEHGGCLCKSRVLDYPEVSMAILRVRTTFVGITGSPWLSTSYFLGAAPLPTQTEANNAVLAVGAFWGSLDNNMRNIITWTTQPEVGIVEVTGELIGLYATTPQTGTGGLAGEMLPLAAQGVIKWRTGVFLGGREIRGRTFVPGLSEGANAEGVPTTTQVTAMNTAATALIADANSTLAIWSRKGGTAVSALTGTAWTQWGVLRSRRD